MNRNRRIFFSLALVLLIRTIALGNSLPESIGPLKLLKLESGEEARKEIDRLHGKELSYLEGHIGTYGNGEEKAKVWVSVHHSEAGAAEAIGKMAQKLRSHEQTNFWHFQEMHIEGVMVYFVVGMGQGHYFFQKGAKSVWLSVDPSLAKESIRDLIGRFP